MTVENPSTFVLFWIGIFLAAGIILLHIYPKQKSNLDKWFGFIIGLFCVVLGSFFLGSYAILREQYIEQLKTKIEQTNEFTSAYREYTTTMDDYIEAMNRYNDLRKQQIDDLTQIIDIQKRIIDERKRLLDQ
jgi:hypothetical protein